MHDRIRTGMAEATRLTRAGQLIEATAIIQRTLQGMSAPSASSNTTDRPRDEPIDVTLFVSDVAPMPAKVSVQEPDRQTSTCTVAELPPLDVAVSPHESGRTRSEVRAGGQFIDGSYTNQAGTRSYKLYIPSGYRGQALPLVVMLHGCTQTPSDFALGSRMNVLAEKEMFFVVYPAQATFANQSKCWNWFKVTDQHRGRGEPSIIAGITHQIISTYHVDARRVYVAGLSAGGAMAAIMGVSYPDLYAAIGVHSGLAYGAAHDLPSAFAAMQNGGATPARQQDSRFLAAGTCTRLVPTIVFHGDRDTTVHQRNGNQVLAQWDTVAGTNLRVAVTQRQVPNGRAYTHSIYHDASGQVVMEQWLVHGAGHAWSGGSPNGSFTDPKGPDASQEMIRFFYKHSQSES